MKSDKIATTSYAALQASFWMDVCVALAFAAVYLHGIGYTDSVCGIIIAAGCLTSAILGPALSSLIDRNETERIKEGAQEDVKKRKKVTASGLMLPLIFTRAVIIALLLLDPAAGIMTQICFALYIGLALSTNSLILKLYVDAGRCGLAINYGVARGCGSFAYVLISVILGELVSRSSVRTVLICAAAICFFQLLTFLLFSVSIRRETAEAMAETAEAAAGKEWADSDTEKQTTQKGSGLLKFAADNKRFCLLLFGTLLIFFSHNTLCNFMINVTENVGGNAADMGLLNGFQAVVEIPVMLLFSRLFAKKDMSVILKVAFIFFTFKAVAVAAAGTIPMLAAALLFQAASFALYTPAIVPYIEKNIKAEDAAKAQSLAYTMTTVSSVIVGTVSGALLEHTSVAATLWVAAAICLAGTIISIAGLEKTNSKTDE